MEGSSVAAGSGGCQCEDFGPPSAPTAPREWCETSQCRAVGIQCWSLRSGSSYTDVQDEIPSSRSGRRNREILTDNTTKWQTWRNVRGKVRETILDQETNKKCKNFRTMNVRLNEEGGRERVGVCDARYKSVINSRKANYHEKRMFDEPITLR